MPSGCPYTSGVHDVVTFQMVEKIISVPRPSYSRTATNSSASPPPPLGGLRGGTLGSGQTLVSGGDEPVEGQTVTLDTPDTM